MDEWSKKYGDIYGMFHGDAPFLMVKDLELLRRVFITDFRLFTERGEVWRMLTANPDIRNSISFADGYHWKFSRRHIAMGFTAAKLRPLVGGMNEAMERFMDLLEDRCREAPNGEVSVFKLMGALAFDMVAETACGLTLDVQHKHTDGYFDSARNMMFNVIESVFQKAGQFFSGISGLVPLTCLLEQTFDREPLLALAQKTKPLLALRDEDPRFVRPDVTQSLLDAKVPKELLSDRGLRTVNGDLLMPTRDVASNIATLLVAGYETVSASGTYAMFCLAKYPEIQEKVRQEVNAVFKKYGSFSYDALSELPYTTQTIFETLRLYSPVIAFTTRRASRDYHYKDMVIPKGVSIMACMHQIHKDPNLWDRPDEFDPERFSPEKKASRDPLAFQPYGIGPRNCVGLRVAQLEITLIVARLVHRFRLHLGSQHADGELRRKTQSIIATPKDGVFIRVERI